MKRVPKGSVVLDGILITSDTLLTGWSIQACSHFLQCGFWGNGILTMMGIVMFLLYLIGGVRLILFLHPIKSGDIHPDTFDFFIYTTYILLWANILYPISRLLPPLLSRTFYQLLGAKLGPNTYIVGTICDPFFVSMGANGIVGINALVVPHSMEDESLRNFPIQMGNNVTIGAHAVVMGGCTIGEGAIVAMNAVVPMNTIIKPYEIWGGVPARLMGRRHADQPETKSKGDRP